MDPQTLRAYDLNAAGFAQDWHDQPPPSDLQTIVRQYFERGLTADIGCGSGREVAWLNANGYAAIGYDASDRLLAEARARYPDCCFTHAALPELAGLAASRFDNVLCETVIMHLPRALIASAVQRLIAILKPGGSLYLSWRVTEGADRRDSHGRLYSAFDADLVHRELQATALLRDETVVSASSGNVIHYVVARKLSGSP